MTNDNTCIYYVHGLWFAINVSAFFFGNFLFRNKYIFMPNIKRVKDHSKANGDVANSIFFKKKSTISVAKANQILLVDR